MSLLFHFNLQAEYWLLTVSLGLTRGHVWHVIQKDLRGSGTARFEGLPLCHSAKDGPLEEAAGSSRSSTCEWWHAIGLSALLPAPVG